MSVLDERKKIIQQLVPDEEMQLLVFGPEKRQEMFLSEDKKCIKYIFNVLTLTIFLLYKNFVLFKKKLNASSSEERNKCVNSFSNSLIRIYNQLDGFYSSKRITFELIENIILDLQIDTVLSHNKSFLKLLGMDKFLSFVEDENRLGKYIFSLKKSRISTRYNPEFGFNDLCRFLEYFPYLKQGNAIFYNVLKQEDRMQKVDITFDKGFYAAEKLSLDQLIVSMDGSIYYLEGFQLNDPRRIESNNKNKEQSLTATYVNFLNPVVAKVIYSDVEIQKDGLVVYEDTAIEDFLLNLQVFSIINSDERAYFFKDYVFFNNKYIKYLALVISDVLDYNSKCIIMNAYKTKYQKIFEKLKFNKIDNDRIMQWDEILIFLLLEEGIYNFLKFLLKETDIQYGKILDGFRLRFGEKVDRIIEKNKLIDQTSIEHNSLDIKIKSQANSLIVFATELLMKKGFESQRNNSKAAINDIIDEINRINDAKGMRDMDKIAYYFTRIIGVNMFIYTFYSGLFEYIGYKKIEEINELEKLVVDDSNGIIAVKKTYLNAFSTETKRVRRMLDNRFMNLLSIDPQEPYTYGQKIKSYLQDSFHLLFELNSSASKRNDKKNEQLFEILGKRKIFEPSDMEWIENKFLSIIERKDSAAKMEQNLHDQLIAYLGYLRDGSKEDTNNIEDSIYPVIGSYSNGVITRDGYRYSYMNANHGEKGHQVSIKMITEEEFEFGEIYYCVPNINRVATIPRGVGKEDESIWVSPIIIPYNAYSPNVNAVVQKLTNKEDYEMVSKLLYETDSKIYGNLFSSVENAQKVLPILFEHKSLNAKSFFHKDYIYVMKVADKNGNELVVAIATMYSSLPEWRPDLIEYAFNEAGIPLPPTTVGAFQYFKDTFNESFGDNYLICDLSVHSDYRNKGYAKHLLSKLIQVAEENGGKNVVLSVYEDNAIAFSLYRSLGFIPYARDYDNRGMVDNKEKYFKMIKYT